MSEVAQVCAKKAWHKVFIGSSQIPNLTHTPVPRSKTDAEHLEVRPCGCDCNPYINSNFNVKNGFFYFDGHELTQIGE